jgi:ribose transport system ATP-binding protein
MINTVDFALSIQNISKRYAGIQALDNVSIDFRKGETHALVGENGAGKSTLIKIISGAEVPDSGRIQFEDQTFEKMTPHLAQSVGVATIYQEFNLFPTLSVAENIFMGDEAMKKESGRFYHKKVYIENAKKVLGSMNVNFSPTELIEDMTTAKMQLVEIAKAVAKNAKILIMDEPTAPLSTKETEALFKLIGHLKQQGVTIIYISHRLEELYRIADCVTVMRDGKKIITAPIGEITRHDLIFHMANRKVEEIEFQSSPEKGDVVLRAQNLCGNGLKDISFSVCHGEILGIGGLLGAGRTELARILFGADKAESGDIFVNGKQVAIKSPKHAVSLGIAYVPEDRKHHGAILSLPINWNITLPILKRISKNGFINKKTENSIVETQRTNLLIKAAHMSNNVDSLSGGNQQKVVLAKWLASNPSILILDEPTRGVDVNAKQEIYHLIAELSKQGIAIIFISSEMGELLNISDRLMILYEKKVVGFLEKEEFSQNKVLAMASGIN